MKRKTESVSREELYDTPDERSLPGRLGQFLEFCHHDLTPHFARLDAAALRFQRNHRWLTLSASLLGGLALIAASIELGFPGGKWSSRMEAVAALAAAILVLLGLAARYDRRWLTARYKAERCRLLKFQSLADPRIWADRDLDWQRKLQVAVHEIEGIEREDLEGLAHHEPMPDASPVALADQVPDDIRRAVIVYYRAKRLEPQIEYFGRRSESTRILDNPILLPLIFFGGIVFVILHLLAEWIGHYAPEAEKTVSNVAKVATIVSLCLPAAWAAFRTYGRANEFARNRSRSKARENALRQVANRLAQAQAPGDLFFCLLLSEYILAADQHEWLRLMLDAEWYG
jgi:hypothetical protein